MAHKYSKHVGILTLIRNKFMYEYSPFIGICLDFNN
jgi:hypothetical protein